MQSAANTLRIPSADSSPAETVDRPQPLKCLIPDLPSADELLPWLRELDARAWYSNFGPLVRRLESEIVYRLYDSERDHSSIHTVTTSSGTTALELAIRALNLPPTSKILLPSLTFPATVISVLQAGHVPVLSDVDEQTWSLTPAMAKETLRHIEVACVCPVATFGRAQDAAGWDSFVTETGIKVVLDAAAALGEQPIGNQAIVAFSLHATKPFGVGEGGLVVCRDAAIIERIRTLTNFGFEQGIISDCGVNSKMSEYHAAVGLAQLRRFPDIRRRRQRLFAGYMTKLASLDGVEMQATRTLTPPATLSVRLSRKATEVLPLLAEKGIETRRWYCPPVHRHPAFESLTRMGVDGSTNLDVSERLGETLLGLPFHTRLKLSDIDWICSCLGDLL